jgi:hypothetical protein
MTITEFIRADLLRTVADQGPDLVPVAAMPGPEQLAVTEWSPSFERAMRCRLQMGAFRYGRLGQKKPYFDRVRGIKKRLEQYEETGNLECLVDVGNLALLEYVEGTHPRRHFRSMSDDHTCI